jgi:glycosyltransferase involved in cell wall biosynthesis
MRVNSVRTQNPRSVAASAAIHAHTAATPPRVWIIGELYYPELVSSGWYATGLAESLTSGFDVHVICAQPNYEAGNTIGPRHEVRNRVRIIRCFSGRLNRHNLLARSINLIQLTVAMSLQALLRIRRGDVVLVGTNPPSLPFTIALCCRIRRARCIVNLQDLYPDSLVTAGIVPSRGAIVRILHRLNRFLYGAADRIVVDGRDAQRIVASRSSKPDRVTFIPLWADLDEVEPMPSARRQILGALGIDDRFVAQYSGNMGRLHDMETILDAAEILIGEPRIHFLLRGSGAKRRHVDDSVKRRGLHNVTVQDFAPRTELGPGLNACDVGLIALMPDAQGVAIPCRMYNLLAAGKPIVAAADHDTELATVVSENDVGWVCRPGDPSALANVLRLAAGAPDVVREMGVRARAVAVDRYSKQRAVAAFRDCLQAVLLDSSQA